MVDPLTMQPFSEKVYAFGSPSTKMPFSKDSALENVFKIKVGVFDESVHSYARKTHPFTMGLIHGSLVPEPGFLRLSSFPFSKLFGTQFCLRRKKEENLCIGAG